MSLQDDVQAALASPVVAKALERRELHEAAAKIEAAAITNRSLGYAELLTEELMHELFAHGMIHSGVLKEAARWLRAAGYEITPS